LQQAFILGESILRHENARFQSDPFNQSTISMPTAPTITRITHQYWLNLGFGSRGSSMGLVAVSRFMVESLNQNGISKNYTPSG